MFLADQAIDRIITGPICSLLIMAVVMIVLFVAAGGVFSWFKRKFRDATNERVAGKGFEIEELERMLNTGLISRQEFDRLRRNLLDVHRNPKGLINSSKNDDGQTISKR